MAKIANRYSEQATLDVPTITRAAMHIVHHDGLNALTMRRLGAELGVEAMSLYHHIPNKAALLDLIVAATFDARPMEDVPPPPDPVEALDQDARHLRDLLEASPEIVPLVIADPPRGQLDAVFAASRTSLARAGFDDQAVAWITDSTCDYVLGSAALRRSGQVDGDDAGHTHATFDTGLRLLLLGVRAELGG